MADETPKLTHVDEAGRANMVDVGAKPDTDRDTYSDADPYSV